jgi:outer membrane receptor protein involved in Fe transport
LAEEPAEPGSVQFALRDEEDGQQPVGHDPNLDGQSQFEESVWVRFANFKQPQPARVPRREVTADVAPPATGRLAERNITLPTSLLTQGLDQPSRGPATESVASGESQTRASTDAGSLIGRSPSLLGVGTQKRTPIVNDPRIRGSRIGQLAAAGSYWVPARIDLDTAVSKIDSHAIDEITIIKGPYSAQYGPGWNFMVIDLLNSPRFANGPESHSSTEATYHTNGQQLMGRATLWGGDESSGYRANYVHRTGNDYLSGDGTPFTASYNSRELDLALGRTFEYGGYFEFNYLRLDQTGVEFPGQAFDIDDLGTDGFEFEAGLVEEEYFDQLAVEFWYNRTRFNGFQGPSKLVQFPIFALTNYNASTNVDAMSLGYKTFVSWGDPDDDILTIGSDLRLIRQDLNEITASGNLPFPVAPDANSPIPKSYSVDPGVYFERFVTVADDFRVRAGGRASWTTTDVVENVGPIGNYPTGAQPTLAEVLGTDQFNQNFKNVSGYLTSEFDVDNEITLRSGIGAARRPPSLTELYAAQPFMFLIQNGLNTVTGNPLLRPETMAQVDLGMTYQDEWLWAGLSGFHGWGIDYITFENTSQIPGPPLGQPAQTNLQYVNTDLATFAGFEAFLQHETNDWLTSFATVSYVDGRDRTRNGNFATQMVGGAGAPSMQVAGNRGSAGNSTVTNLSQEPLPGILPMDARLGWRLHGQDPARWGIEVSARVVRMQNRVATSLNETPTAGFTVWDLRSYWQATDSMRLVSGLENFGNKNFREHLDFRTPGGYQLFQPGISFYFGSELAF